ncbi:MAG TPA: hypothetical protein EYQ68_02520 [Cytophagales bacterium]|nr:hypothetical protein [Cytophagales bacterium]
MSDIKIDESYNKNNITIDKLTFRKMNFIYNALEKGWSVTKKKELYIFKKSHEGKKEVYLDDYLTRFMQDNFDMSLIS